LQCRLTILYGAHKRILSADDCVIVTILDWKTKYFRLTLETAARRAAHANEIAHKNKIMADILFALLEAEREEGLSIGQAIPAAYAHHPDARGYPGDPWAQVIEKDPRMAVYNWMIRYAE